MVLQTVVPIGYQIVQHSWMVAALLTKFYLVGLIGFVVYFKGFDLDSLKEKLLLDCRFVVGFYVLCGALLYVTGLEFTPIFVLFSEFVALVYLGFLFWEY